MITNIEKIDAEIKSLQDQIRLLTAERRAEVIRQRMERKNVKTPPEKPGKTGKTILTGSINE
jgi:hypothetical protein